VLTESANVVVIFDVHDELRYSESSKTVLHPVSIDVEKSQTADRIAHIDDSQPDCA